MAKTPKKPLKVELWSDETQLWADVALDAPLGSPQQALSALKKRAKPGKYRVVRVHAEVELEIETQTVARFKSDLPQPAQDGPPQPSA